MKFFVAMLLVVLAPWQIVQASTLSPDVVMLPLNCEELLPETAPFLNFFEAVARGQVRTDPQVAKRMFKIMALRNRLDESENRGSAENPVDKLIRKTLCFYRQQKEPIRPIAFDDFKLTNFLKSSLKELETKVSDEIYQWEFARQQREAYIRQIDKNQRVIEELKLSAEESADSTYSQIEKKAKRRLKDR